MPAVISVVSNAQGLPADTLHDIAALALTGQSFIEADTMPAATLPRTSVADELPPAIAMVSFGIDALHESTARWIAPPQALPIAPYYGRSVGVCTGVAGELIELIGR